MAKEVAKYKGGLDVFYEACEAILELVKKNLPEFSRHKGYYTVSHIDDLIAKLMAAKQMRATCISVAERKLARKALKAAGKKLRDDWQVLKSYTTAGFGQDEWEGKLEEAGSALFKRRDTDWGSISLLGVEALRFIDENEARLMANDNMPAGFKADFETAVQEFEALKRVFSTKTGNKVLGAAAKIKANNAVYESVVAISRDAAIVYRSDDKRRLFAYKYQVEQKTGGAATLKGTVTNERGLPAADVVVEDSTGAYKTVTNAKGYFKLRMREGEHLVLFVKGNRRVELPVVLKPATRKTVRIVIDN